MKLYSQNEYYKLYNGDMRDLLEVIDKESIDVVLTDPPYGLTSITKRFGKENSAPASTKNNDGSFARLSKGFMGKEWDGSGIEYNVDTWKKCYEVLKPGGYLLAFGGSRTFHRIACAIEDAGFEIRDTIMWLYGSGFPKSMNIGLAIDKKNGVDNRTGNIKKDGVGSDSDSKIYNVNNGKSNLAKEYEERKALNEWDGWGTALKPSFEPIIVARKPFKGSCVDNVIKNGVGGINIDECRVETNDNMKPTKRGSGVFSETANGKITGWNKDDYNGDYQPNEQGRFPANTILTYDDTDFDEVCGGFPNTKSGKNGIRQSDGFNKNDYGKGIGIKAGMNNGEYGDSGSASRYFYCAKASKKDRDEGLDEFEEKQKYYCDGRSNSLEIFGSTDGGRKPLKNIHPTVKPTELMQYLVRLVTPNGGTILDPFNGSGSTGKAVMYENLERNKNYKYIGIELTEEYLPISKARIEYISNQIKEQDKWSDLD